MPGSTNSSHLDFRECRNFLNVPQSRLTEGRPYWERSPFTANSTCFWFSKLMIHWVGYRLYSMSKSSFRVHWLVTSFSHNCPFFPIATRHKVLYQQRDFCSCFLMGLCMLGFPTILSIMFRKWKAPFSLMNLLLALRPQPPHPANHGVLVLKIHPFSLAGGQRDGPGGGRCLPLSLMIWLLSARTHMAERENWFTLASCCWLPHTLCSRFVRNKT